MNSDVTVAKPTHLAIIITKIEPSTSTATTRKGLAMSKPVSSYLSLPAQPFLVDLLHMYMYMRCICICMYACTHTCMYVRMYVCMSCMCAVYVCVCAIRSFDNFFFTKIIVVLFNSIYLHSVLSQMLHVCLIRFLGRLRQGPVAAHL